jgi:hypothetical protein
VYKEFFNVEEYVDEHIKSVKHWLDAFEFGELS